MNSQSQAIEKRIAELGQGYAFTASDFSDIATFRNAGNVLGRLHARGKIARAVRGVYYVPEHSKLLNADIPASVDEVVRAISRTNKWIVAPNGDTALNRLGLDTQVPARYIYVSSGPYKTYDYNGTVIELKHRASRDLLDCSDTTRAVVQALRALGQENVDERTLKTLTSILSVEEIDAFRREASDITAWIAEFADNLWREKHAEHS